MSSNSFPARSHFLPVTLEDSTDIGPIYQDTHLQELHKKSLLRIQTWYSDPVILWPWKIQLIIGPIYIGIHSSKNCIRILWSCDLERLKQINCRPPKYNPPRIAKGLRQDYMRFCPSEYMTIFRRPLSRITPVSMVVLCNCNFTLLYQSLELHRGVMLHFCTSSLNPNSKSPPEGRSLPPSISDE